MNNLGPGQKRRKHPQSRISHRERKTFSANSRYDIHKCFFNVFQVGRAARKFSGDLLTFFNAAVRLTSPSIAFQLE